MLDAIESRLESISEIKSVDGAVALAAVMKSGKAPNRTPAVYVVPIRETPIQNNRTTGPAFQKVVEQIAIVIVIKKANDKTGNRANGDLKKVRDEIRDRIFGFSIAEYEPVELGPSGLLSFEDGVLWWQDEFLTARYREADNG